MRYLVLCVLAGLLAWPQRVAAQTGEDVAPNAGLAIHAQNRLPPPLMLRASYYYQIDVDPLSGPAPAATTEEREPTKRLSRRARIAIGVTVPIVVVGVGVGVGLGVAVSSGWSSSWFQ